MIHKKLFQQPLLLLLFAQEKASSDDAQSKLIKLNKTTQGTSPLGAASDAKHNNRSRMCGGRKWKRRESVKIVSENRN